MAPVLETPQARVSVASAAGSLDPDRGPLQSRRTARDGAWAQAWLGCSQEALRLVCQQRIHTAKSSATHGTQKQNIMEQNTPTRDVSAKRRQRCVLTEGRGPEACLRRGGRCEPHPFGVGGGLPQGINSHQLSPQKPQIPFPGNGHRLQRTLNYEPL